MSSALKPDAQKASETQPTQASAPSDLHKKEPFTIDVVARWLDQTVLRTPVLLAIPALVYLYDRHLHTSVSLAPYPPAGASPFSHVFNLLQNQYKWIGRFLIFGVLKALNHHLNRYFANLGVYAADKPNWSREVIVVTGGSAGIGKALVEILSHVKRAKVAVLDMAPPQYAPAPAGAPPIQFYKTDVTDPEQVKAAADAIRSTFGDVTMLVNNAGVATADLITDANPDGVARTWKVNTLSNWITCKEFLPAMIKRNHGHIMTVASSASFMSLPQMSAYTASKSATLAFHEVLRGELRTRYNAPRVRASIVGPTKVRTSLGDGMEDHKMPFLHPTLEAWEVARSIVSAFDSGLSHYMVLPGSMKILPAVRCMPDWGRRIVELIGHTDNTVSDDSMARAFKNGYGKEWTGEAAAHRQRVLERLAKEGKM